MAGMRKKGEGWHCTFRFQGRRYYFAAGNLTEEQAQAKGVEVDETLDLIERGRLVVAGYHQDGLRQVNMQLWNWRGLDVINAHERDPQVYLDGIRRAAAAVTAGVLCPAPLYSRVYPLEELGAALDATRDRPDGFMKALITF